jgi:hypothetical protein
MEKTINLNQENPSSCVKGSQSEKKIIENKDNYIKLNESLLIGTEVKDITDDINSFMRGIYCFILNY